ncbi:MAG: hypothetical protein ACRBBU_06105 [Pseudooceanicola sp.]
MALFLLLIAVAGIEFIASKTLGYPPILRFIMHELPFRGQSFDTEKWADEGSCTGLSDWKCAEKEASCPRGPMVRDLLRNHLLIGETKSANATTLLGAMEYEVDIRGHSCDAYCLGMCSGLGIDYDALYVCYSENGTISSTGHIQH